MVADDHVFSFEFFQLKSGGIFQQGGRDLFLEMKLRRTGEYLDSTDVFSAGHEDSSFGHESTGRLDELRPWKQDEIDDGTGSYSPSVSQRMDPPGKVPDGDTVEKSMDRAWMQMSTQPVQQFWEKGFWAEFFGDANSASSQRLLMLWTCTVLMFRSWGILR